MKQYRMGNKLPARCRKKKDKWDKMSFLYFLLGMEMNFKDFLFFNGKSDGICKCIPNPELLKWDTCFFIIACHTLSSPPLPFS
jgi:hypothetical protein